jgi:uncharacterized protein YndB with AHSA1/START domain
MKTNEAPVVVSQYFESEINKVWSAITVLDEMKQWYFENIDSFKPKSGTKSRFAVQSGERVFTHLWEIVVVNAPHKIVYNWKYEEYEGDSFVCFELEELNEGTKLTLSTKVTADFDDEIPEFRRCSCENGWQFFIQQRLKAYLAI